MKLLIALTAATVLSACNELAKAVPVAGPTTPTPTAFHTLSGTVRDSTGQAIAGVAVAVSVHIHTRLTETTDAEGRYQFSLPQSTHELAFTKQGFRNSTVRVELMHNTVADVVMERGVVVSGNVIEEGVGPLSGATVEIVGGASVGRSQLTGSAGVTAGSFSFGYLPPGEIRLRVSKEGFEPVEESRVLDVSNGSFAFTLRWAHGGCLQSVSPLSFAEFPAAGGRATVFVQAAAERSWQPVSSTPWLEAPTELRTGSQRLDVNVQPYPIGGKEKRNGTVMIRCSASEQHGLTFVQRPDCQVGLFPTPLTPLTFDAAGGVGYLRMDIGVLGCDWDSEEDVDWLHTVGISRGPAYPPNGELSFLVRPNPTGAPRVGRIRVSDTVWVVNQR